jgi:response regulator NasT
MKSIIVAYPIKDTAMQIRNLLESNGFYVSHICATGASVLSIASEMSDGVVVCASILRDMGASVLAENLPANFDVVALSRDGKQNYMGNLISIPLPINREELIDTVSVLVSSESSFTQRKGDDADYIYDAKLILMNFNNMNEGQAHKYLQKESMKSGKKLVDVAKEIIKLFS